MGEGRFPTGCCRLPSYRRTRSTYDSEEKLYQRQRPKQNQTSVNVKVTTTYAYDALHRVTSTTYDDGSTPTTSLAYDERVIRERHSRTP